MKTRRRQAGPAPAAGRAGEAILLFDTGGSVVFASPGVPDLVDGPIARQSDLERALSLEPGAALAAAELVGGSWTERPLESADGRPGHRLRLTVHAIELALGEGEPVRLVVARDVAGSRESQRMQDAFSRILAHELRTPITSIYGGAQLIADPSISTETRTEAARTVAAEAERLYRTVEDLLVFARFDEPLELSDSPVLLQRFVPQLARAEAERFTRVRVAASIPEDLPAVRGRQAAIEQVLRHLLASAARFAPLDSTIRIRAVVNGDLVEVRVVDHGPPISAEEAATMFDLFSRTPRTSSDASGANLGMFVARRLVEAMGGTLRALASRHPTLIMTLPVFPIED
jgi:signal transduction histidine kinase